MREGTEGEFDNVDLKGLLGILSATCDRLLAEVGAEYEPQPEQRPEMAEQIRAEEARRLLRGERHDGAQLAYDLDGHHVGIVISGLCTEPMLRHIAHGIDRRLLFVHAEENTAWAWLGGHGAPDRDALDRLTSASWPDGAVLALGEPAEGLAGWRLTHRQAAAALPVALRRGESIVRYTDVVLIAAGLGDDLLATSLRELYLKPLEDERGEGKAARETLAAYFAAACNVSSAAAALGVHRSTVSSRLRSIERRLGRRVESNRAEFEVSLNLAKLQSADADLRPHPHIGGGRTGRHRHIDVARKRT